ncbi:MAG: Ppx/GppA family phosphatase [Alphaproteobacteria bacterium]|nr:Ppx/GppA family phosphatase [Alphaproteobacteria bacterium]
MPAERGVRPEDGFVADVLVGVPVRYLADEHLLVEGGIAFVWKIADVEAGGVDDGEISLVELLEGGEMLLPEILVVEVLGECAGAELLALDGAALALEIDGETEDAAIAALYAVGGAWRSLAQLHMAISDYPLKVVHQYAMSAADAREVARFAARQSRASLEKSPGISRRRAETLPYAALVLEGLIEHLGFEEISFSAWGVREGLLFEALGEKTLAADPLLAGTAALGARQGVSPGLPGAVAGWISALTGSLPSAFAADREAVLTRAACNLCDLGARLHPDHRVELAFDQVLRASIPGQTHVERAFLAAAISARYGGPSGTPEPGTIERLLDDDLRSRARALGLAIRLACDLSGRSPQLLANAALVLEKGTLRLSATPTYADMLLGEQTRRRARALAEALGAELVIEGVG